MRFLQYVFCVALLAGISTKAVNAQNNIAVVELFTANGCSASIYGDKLFYELSQNNDDNVILLSCHITKFDDEKSTDLYSQDFCDYRMSQYTENVLYTMSTPQMVFNGRFTTGGARAHIVRDAINLAKSLDTVQPVQLELSSQTLSITLPKMRLERPLDVWLFAYKKHADDNEKNTATIVINDLAATTNRPLVNIATHAKKLLKGWNGDYKNLNLQTDDYEADGYIVLAQYPEHTDIMAAGRIEKP